MSSPAQLPLLVIDTNMVYTDHSLEKSHWKALALAVAAGEVAVVVPEIVVRETARHMQTNAKTARKQVENAVKQIEENLKGSALSPDWPVLSTLPAVHELRASEELTEEQARQRFRDRLTEMGFGVAPVPAPPHDQLVDWSLRSTPPFDQTDKGYRDALIWWTFVEEAKADPHRCVVYVSNDNDCLVKGETTPRPQLATQLDELGLKAVRFARGIAGALAIAQQVLAEAEAAVEAEAEAAAEALPGARVRELLDQPMRDYLFNFVGGALVNETLDADQAPFADDIVLPDGVESPTVTEVGLPEPLVQTMRYGYSGRALIGSGRTLPLSLGYEGFLHKSDYYALRDDDLDHVTVLDPDWNDHMVEVGGYLAVVAEFSFSIDPVEQSVLAVEITRIRTADVGESAPQGPGHDER